jgi:hypothetical protein
MCSARQPPATGIGENHSEFLQLLNDMEASLSGRRKNGNPVNEITLPDGSRFLLRQLLGMQDANTDQAHSFMIAEFGAEAETKEWFRHAIEKRINTFFVLLNEERVVGLSNSQYLILKGQVQDSTKCSILAVWHISVDQGLRKRGLAKHLEYAMLRRAYFIAKRCRHLFVGVCAEAVETAEPVFNKLHCRRVYYQDQVGDIHELAYVCPPVDYNAMTGALLGPAVPEHLMLGILNDPGHVRKGLLLRIIWTMYVEYLGTRTDYASYVAYEQAKRSLQLMLKGIEEKLSGSTSDELILLTRDERHVLSKTLCTFGRRIIEMKNAGSLV